MDQGLPSHTMRIDNPLLSAKSSEQQPAQPATHTMIACHTHISTRVQTNKQHKPETQATAHPMALSKTKWNINSTYQI